MINVPFSLKKRKIKGNLGKSSYGFGGEYGLFSGYVSYENDTAIISWGNETNSIQGHLNLKTRIRKLSPSSEILEESKFSLLDIFNSVGLDYWYTDDGQREYNSIYFNLTTMEDNNMILETRSTYPSDKMTLTLADVPRDKSIVFLNIYLDMNDEFDVALVLEDSRRNKLCDCQKI